MNPGGLRVSDADRDSVTEVLHAAYAEGRITLDEHAERTTAAMTAKTFDDLSGLTDDLVPAALRPAPLVAVPYAPKRDRVSAMLAETKQVGPLRVGRRLEVHVVAGSAVLDLTEATFTDREVEIACTQFMGSITIRVRPGTTVRLEPDNVLGESSAKRLGDPSAREPTIVVRGTNVLGEISIRGPKRALLWRRHVA